MCKYCKYLATLDVSPDCLSMSGLFRQSYSSSDSSFPAAPALSRLFVGHGRRGTLMSESTKNTPGDWDSSLEHLHCRTGRAESRFLSPKHHLWTGPATLPPLFVSDCGDCVPVSHCGSLPLSSVWVSAGLQDAAVAGLITGILVIRWCIQGGLHCIRM